MHVVPKGVPLMRVKSVVVLAVAFAGLLLLVLVSLLAARRKAQEVYTQLDEVNMLHRHVESKLRRLRSDINLSGIFIRDYLLDNAVATGPYYREELAGLRTRTMDTLAELSRSVGAVGTHEQRLQGLKGILGEYWEAFDPVLDWTPEQKAALSFSFLRKEVLPRRDAVLAIAQEIEEVNNANMKEQRNDVAGRERGLHSYLNQMLLFSLLFGTVVAVATVCRLSTLESRSEAQRHRAEAAETELRALSQQLVRVHEEERRSLSRELHDEVGQILTGLRMEFGKAERAHLQSSPSFLGHMGECKQLVDKVIQTVRDLSMGLRPSLLDDFGLGAALEWQARDFLRRYGVPVNVRLEGGVDTVGEPHRTSIYRVVQEALTNCARHAQAGQISISVRQAEGQLSVVIHDDGIGLGDSEERPAGLGLLGMKERVRELGGKVSLHSAKGVGTTITIALAVPNPETEAHAAGSRS